MSIVRFLPVKLAPYLLFGYHGNSYSDNLSRKWKSVKTKFQDLSVQDRVTMLFLGLKKMNKNVFWGIFLLIIIIKDFPQICQ